ncbi:sulfatase family protein [Cerasicoccus frondis]|uniref:sulfatase family protein n=1 Tax=Cerasicoccus frondis TaxID=490090 RepID=UPI002852D21E|nr:sulfatase-like hydrolase/transferase [Cerasicoccus frondis]
MAKSHPNVLLLFSDQHQASVLGCEGHPDIRTPHIDSLAASGTRFTRGYCQNAICVPSRSSLFSGLYPRTLGCYMNMDRSSVMEEVVSLPAAFQRAGYHTAAFGKRHLESGCDAGWVEQASHFIKESPDDNYVSWINDQGLGEAFDRDWGAEFAHGAEGWVTETKKLPISPMSQHVTELTPETTMEAWTRRRTVDFIHSRSGKDQPFFCWASFYRPHQPYTPLKEFYDRFDRSHWGSGRNKGDGLAMPASMRQDPATMPPVFRELLGGSNQVWPVDQARKNEQIYRDIIAGYYALVEEIDDHVGSILKALKDSGQFDDTIIIYASDHGDFVGAHGMVEKCSAGHNVYEETVRVPLILHWRNHIAEGRVNQSLVELVDLYPTLLDLCGVPIPTDTPFPLAGQSLAYDLLNGKKSGRPFVITENAVQSTIITERYKLGVWQETRGAFHRNFYGLDDMLFDRVEDPYEMHNRIGDPVLLEVEKELRCQLAKWEAKIPSAPPESMWEERNGA